MCESEINLEYAYKLGLSKDEFEEIQKNLQRNPTHTEIFIYSTIWSDNGSHKNNEANAQDLAKKIKKILDESGIEKKGTIDIDNEISCFLNIESALSLQFNETYNESANHTINLYRELISKGAKAISGINSFHFGTLKLENTKESLIEFIKGSSNYSNAFGAPVVGIQAYFNECNLNNPMLNSFIIGVLNKENGKLFKQPKPGNKILMVGLEHESKINSAFYEKLLHDTISETHKSNLIIDILAITDSTLINSCIQLSSQSGLGIEIDLENIKKVHEIDEIQRKLDSVSIASFLIICEQDNYGHLLQAFKNSGLDCISIGQLTENLQFAVLNKSEVIADLPLKTLNNRAKASQEISSEISYNQKETEFSLDKIPVQNNLREVAWFLIKHPNIISKKWISEQYDSMVGVSNMSTNFPSSAALVNLKESNSALAMSLENNSRYFKANPEIGIQIAVAEAARKIVCTGAKPHAITVGFNFLNFENKIDNGVFGASLKGLTKACKQFKIQLSNYKINVFDVENQEDSSIQNCLVPIIGMIGILKDKNHQMTISFKNKGNIIFLIGQSKEDISSSEYLYTYHHVKNSPAPWFNLSMEQKMQSAVQELIEKNYVCSVHTVSKGGLFISLVESSLRFGLGFDIITDTDIRTDAFLFGESQGRIIVSITPNKEDHFIDFMMKKEVPFLALGHVTKGEMRVDDISFGFIEDARREYENTFEKMINA